MLFLFLIGFAPAMAQGQANNGNNKERRHFSPEEFQTMMRNYIRDKAGLGDEDQADGAQRQDDGLEEEAV